MGFFWGGLPHLADRGVGEGVPLSGWGGGVSLGGNGWEYPCPLLGLDGVALQLGLDEDTPIRTGWGTPLPSALDGGTPCQGT